MNERHVAHPYLDDPGETDIRDAAAHRFQSEVAG